MSVVGEVEVESPKNHFHASEMAGTDTDSFFALGHHTSRTDVHSSLISNCMTAVVIVPGHSS